jgi:hypothetical protein
VFKTSTFFAVALIAALGALLAAPSLSSASMMSSGTDRYGGPSYLGTPDLAATAEFVQDGGGAAHFSVVRALDALVGPALVRKEVTKLTAQYGKSSVMQWVKTWDFAVPDAVRAATKAGVTFPAPANLPGKELAAALVKAGSTSGTFWTGDMLDHIISNKVHNQVMDDIDAAQGQKADARYHRITNQAMYDLAHALGANSVRLAPLH